MFQNATGRDPHGDGNPESVAMPVNGSYVAFYNMMYIAECPGSNAALSLTGMHPDSLNEPRDQYSSRTS